ncbi:MAG: CDP-alcohol phosphatidyltransferase family protein [Polyangiaceae bacterium]
MPEALDYRSDDRSILLPTYRRWLVEPALPLLPASLSPNAITHLGHLANLLGVGLLVTLWPERGWPFAAAALLLQLYVWCDNADGAHARRTGQCSPFGELLDHGLDILNVLYIAYLTALALGAPPLWWVAVVLLITGAASVTYWEQCQTGVFRLGMMNQVESALVLSATLLISAVWGTSVWEHELALGISFRQAMLLWCAATILFGVMRSMARVARVAGLGAALPVVGLIVFGGGVCAAAATGAISTVAAVMVATAVNIFFPARMLLWRLRSEPPRLELSIAAFALMLWAVAAWARAGLPLDVPGARTHLDVASVILAALACAMFGGAALFDVRASRMLLLPRAPLVVEPPR